MHKSGAPSLRRTRRTWTRPSTRASSWSWPTLGVSRARILIWLQGLGLFFQIELLRTGCREFHEPGSWCFRAVFARIRRLRKSPRHSAILVGRFRREHDGLRRSPRFSAKINRGSKLRRKTVKLKSDRNIWTETERWTMLEMCSCKAPGSRKSPM